jgi:hypothetical protein
MSRLIPNLVLVTDDHCMNLLVQFANSYSDLYV